MTTANLLVSLFISQRILKIYMGNGIVSHFFASQCRMIINYHVYNN